ncbi:hypothetical protein ACGFIW_09645 [Micromonospora sp. NPDC048935]|uniref:hypothetical protein n=1 Tax=Micromonospora sp. NPDC048935 TaxID=3364262 RepID=UPI00371C6C15
MRHTAGLSAVTVVRRPSSGTAGLFAAVTVVRRPSSGTAGLFAAAAVTVVRRPSSGTAGLSGTATVTVVRRPAPPGCPLPAVRCRPPGCRAVARLRLPGYPFDRLLCLRVLHPGR